MMAQKYDTRPVMTEELYEQSMQDIVRYIGAYQELNPEGGIWNASIAMANSALDVKIDMMSQHDGIEPAQKLLAFLPSHLDIDDMLAFGYDDTRSQKTDYHRCFFELAMDYCNALANDADESETFTGDPVEAIAEVVGPWAVRRQDTLAQLYQNQKNNPKP